MPLYGNVYCVTGPLCGQSTDHRWIALTKRQNADFDVLLDANLEKWLNKRSVGLRPRLHPHPHPHVPPTPTPHTHTPPHTPPPPPPSHPHHTHHHHTPTHTGRHYNMLTIFRMLDVICKVAAIINLSLWKNTCYYEYTKGSPYNSTKQGNGIVHSHSSCLYRINQLYCLHTHAFIV